MFNRQPGLTLPAVAAMAVLSLSATTAFAQAYPNKPVRIVVPYVAGGPVDLYQRKFAEKFTAILKQPFVVENRGGANGLIGAEAVARSAPDGYTLLGGTAVSYTPIFNRNPPVDMLRDFEPVGMSNVSSIFIFTSAALPFKSLKDVVDYAKANPGKLNYGSGFASGHLAVEMLKKFSGTDMVYVPYKGSAPARAALLGGEIQLVVDVIAGWKPLIEAGRARGLIVGAPTRSTVLPEVPSNVEAGYPRWIVNSSGNLWAPAITPPDIIVTLNKAQQELLKLPDVAQMLLTNGSQPQPSTPEELRQTLISQMEFWAEAAKVANFKPE